MKNKTLLQKFNPTVKDFLKENQDKTLIGFWWAILWRIYVAVGVLTIGLTFIVYIFE